VAVLLVAAAAAGGVLLYQRASETAYPVPPLVGVEIARARNIVSPYDWVVTERLGRNDEHAKGIVYEQEPASGELERGSEIVLYVSDGPFPSKLPDLVGKAQAQAQQALTSAGLTVSSVTPQFSETVAPGVVLGWTVGGRTFTPGTEVPKGTAVDLVVSRGPQPRTMPNLIGVPYAQAEAQLKQLGLAPLRVPDVFNDTVVAGAVAGTNPAAGTQLAKGAPVAIAVSKGPDVVRVPNVIGMDLQTAVATLTQAGLGQGTISGPITGKVQATNPGPTAVVRRGSPVELILVP
jgi:serine/threonine-protein kinase